MKTLQTDSQPKLSSARKAADSSMTHGAQGSEVATSRNAASATPGGIASGTAASGGTTFGGVAPGGVAPGTTASRTTASTTASSTSAAPLCARELCLSYGEKLISSQLNFALEAGKICAVIGPNACGKSTLLKALARLLKPRSGTVLLNGSDIHRLGTKMVARELGFLPQSPLKPRGLTVKELVATGRYPHQGFLRQWSEADEAAVEEALAATHTSEFADAYLDELSGGQQQRVWIALTLAQDTKIILLDEPTTYLDIVHQIEVLNLCRSINQSMGRSIVMVLHDLNQAARYADHLVMMRKGSILFEGAPESILTPHTIQETFGLKVEIIEDPLSHTPLIIPQFDQVKLDG